MKNAIVQKTASALFFLTLLVMAVTAFCYLKQWTNSATLKQILLWMTILHFLAGCVTLKGDPDEE